jgi:hypothetical protein
LNHKLILCAAAAALALAYGTQAEAATYQFNLTGSYTADFQITSNPTPSQTYPGTFALAGVSGTFQNVAGARDIFFYDAATGGAFGLKNTNNRRFTLVTDGLQLFTGSINAPAFKTGTFALTQFSGAGQYSLTITDLDATVPTVPEPASWALMIAGFGGIGFAARYRGRTKIKLA